MKILQVGMEKSGNYWLYKILQSALHHAQLPTSTYIETQPIHALARTWELSYKEQADIDVLDFDDLGYAYRISSIFRMPLDDIDAYLAHATHVWSHSFFCQRSHTLFPKFDKVVYIIRDPRDVALSMSQFQFTPYMQRYYPVPFNSPEEHLDATLRRYVLRWQRHVSDYLRDAEKLGVYIVFYERLLHDFDQEIVLLLEALGLPTTPEMITAIKQDVDFETMRSENPSHVRKGKASQWVTQLSPKQKDVALYHGGNLLALLGYQTDETQAATLPALPRPLTGAMLDEVIAPPLTVKQRLKDIAKKVIR